MIQYTVTQPSRQFVFSHAGFNLTVVTSVCFTPCSKTSWRQHREPADRYV